MIDNRYPKGTKIVVGVSGGADSVALLDMLVSEGMQCVVAHCQFHLRGEESERDAQFVRQLSEQYRLPFFRIDFQTEAYAQAKGLSIEMAARELRYDWFDELLKREKAEAVAIAHHSDDVVETFLMNLSRGTGLRGLTGIKSRGRIWRPMLNMTRSDVLGYLATRGLRHVEDSTNAENHYTRNQFRNLVIPQMESVNPQFKSNVLSTIAHLQQSETFLDHQLEMKRKRLMHHEGEMVRLFYDELRQEQDLSYLLYEMLSPYGFSPADIASAETNVNVPKSGRSFLASSYVLSVERASFLLTKRVVEGDDNEKTYVFQSLEELKDCPLSISYEKEDAPVMSFDTSRSVCYVDADKLTFPLTLRHWREGDWFVPFGMKGKKKLSDFFVDQRLSVEEKKQVWLLLSEENVLWVVGYRSDNRFRVDTSTRTILKLQKTGN